MARTNKPDPLLRSYPDGSHIHWTTRQLPDLYPSPQHRLCSAPRLSHTEARQKILAQFRSHTYPALQELARRFETEIDAGLKDDDIAIFVGAISVYETFPAEFVDLWYHKDPQWALQGVLKVSKRNHLNYLERLRGFWVEQPPDEAFLRQTLEKEQDILAFLLPSHPQIAEAQTRTWLNRQKMEGWQGYRIPSKEQHTLSLLLPSLCNVALWEELALVHWEGVARALVHALANIGPAIVPLMGRLFTSGLVSSHHHQQILKLLCLIEGPGIADLLVPRLNTRAYQTPILAWCNRYPHLARPVLEKCAHQQDSCGGLARGWLEHQAPTSASVAASAAALANAFQHPLLQAPWLRPRPKAVILSLQTPPMPEWVEDYTPLATDQKRRSGRDIDATRAKLGDPETKVFISTLEEFSSTEALAFWNQIPPERWFGGDYDSRNLVDLMVRLGPEAIDGLLRYAAAKLPSAIPALSKVHSPRVAPFMAEALRGRQTEAAEHWLFEHIEEAVMGLMPVAVSKGRQRAAAGEALRLLVAFRGEALIQELLKPFGPDALHALQCLLKEDIPTKIPDLPPFLSLSELPPLLGLDQRPLPKEATIHLLKMLMFTPERPIFSGLIEARQSCTATSLAEVAWATFQQWAARGAEPRYDCFMIGLGHLADQQTIPRLLAEMRHWYGAAPLRAGRALDALVIEGSDTSLLSLQQLARHCSSEPTQRAAAEKLRHAALLRGLSTLELEDRQVPDLGLREGATLTVATHKYTVVFDAALIPSLQEGTRLHDALPKAGATADPEGFAQAQARWKTLKAQAKELAQVQLARLEQAMILGRRWSMLDFKTYLVDHPLLVHLVRRLSWGVFAGERATGNLVLEPLLSFRVCEDNSFSDSQDISIDLPDGQIGILHPLEMNAPLKAQWEQRFADYKILQPFPQLSRSCQQLPVESRLGAPWLGKTVGWAAISALERRGFKRMLAANPCSHFQYPWPKGGQLLIEVSPGLPWGDPSGAGPQKIVSIQYTGGQALADPVQRSEMFNMFSGL